MTVVFTVAFGLLAVALLLATVRLAVGPSTLDRVVALEVVIILIVAGVGVEIARSAREEHVPLLIAVALVGFIGSLATVRLLERSERHR